MAHQRNFQGHHIGGGRYIGGVSHNYGHSDLSLVPVQTYVNKLQPSMGTKVVWEPYGEKVLSFEFKWAWINSEQAFGWVEEPMDFFDDDWKLPKDPDPVVTVFCSKAIKGKIPKLLKQNDEK